MWKVVNITIGLIPIGATFGRSVFLRLFLLVAPIGQPGLARRRVERSRGSNPSCTCVPGSGGGSPFVGAPTVCVGVVWKVVNVNS